MSTSRTALLFVALLMTQTACQTTGMVFAQQETIKILTPEEREEVSLPIIVTWEVSDDLSVQVATDGGDTFYAIFVDRPPLAARRDLSDLVGNACNLQTDCGGIDWFADRGVYTRIVPSLTLTDLDDLRDRDDDDARDLHEITIVVMQRTGEGAEKSALTGTRINEAVFSRQFYVERGD